MNPKKHHVHPKTSVWDAKEERGRMRAVGLFCIGAFVPGACRAPCRAGVTTQHQQAPRPPRLQGTSSSFQLTLNPRQTEEGIML